MNLNLRRNCDEFKFELSRILGWRGRLATNRNWFTRDFTGYFSEVCKALNKNRGLYGRWSELQDVAITSPTGGGGAPINGAATAPPISRTDELDWTTTELRKALRSIEWDLDDLEDTIYILFRLSIRVSNLIFDHMELREDSIFRLCFMIYDILSDL
jgi:hypothetical protein